MRGWMRRWVLASATIVWTSGHAQAPAPAWPELKLPEGARAEVVAPDMALNGARSRVSRFEVAATPAEVLQFYRREFGTQRVENEFNGTQVVSTRRDDYFHTVQIRPLGPGRAEGTVMSSRIAGAPSRSAVALDTDKMLPSDSLVLTRMQSQDGGRRSVTLLAANAIGTRANRDHLLRTMGERGFRLVKEDTIPMQGRDAVALTMMSATEEAMVTISDAGRYRAVLINRTKEPK